MVFIKLYIYQFSITQTKAPSEAHQLSGISSHHHVSLPSSILNAHNHPFSPDNKPHFFRSQRRCREHIPLPPPLPHGGLLLQNMPSP